MSEWRIGRYEIIERLAQGGMGEVFLARSPGAEGFSKEVVVKRIFPERREDKLYRRLFIREAKVAAELTHPNIVQVFELGEESDDLFIVMELVRGCDLADLVAQSDEPEHRLTWEIASVIAADVLDALDFAHNKRDASGEPRPIVHQDISPQNILVSLLGHVKICDFGIANIHGVSTMAQGLVRGKLAYMAPEQVDPRAVDARTDVYSLGAVLYTCLTGRSPFSYRTLRELREGGPGPMPLAELAPEADAELRAVVERALEPDPASRFASAAEFRAALEPILLRAKPAAARLRLRALVEHASSASVDNAPDASHHTLRARWGALLSSSVHDDDWHVPQGLVETVVASTPEEETELDLSLPVLPPPPRRWLQLGVTTAALLGVLAALALWPAAEPEPVVAVAAPPAAEPAPAPIPPALEPVAVTAPPAPKPARKALRSGEVRYGSLSVNAVPWAHVTIDGTPLGRTTPLVDHRLPVGRHVVRLKGPTGEERELVVIIRANELTQEVVRFAP